MTSLEAKHEAWRRGRFARNYLRPSQLQVYNFFVEQPRPFIEAARRWGKTTSILAYVFEELRTKPNSIVRVCCPEKEQARKIWMPEIDKMQRWAPENLRLKFRTVDTVYLHPNGSKMYLHGMNEDKGTSARGSAAHLIVCDEYGFYRYPETVKNVLAPQVRTTSGKILIASTPPPDLGHPYYEEKALALNEKRFIQRTIYDDETLFTSNGTCINQSVFDQIVKDCGGLDSPTFRREYLCEPIANPESLVVPEFNDTHLEVPERPKFFDAYVGCDLGYNDFTALLFAYYDFLTATLVIEDELILQGKNSKEIVERAKAIEERLWSKQRPYLRVSDNDIQQLYDMATLCDYQLVPTRKDDKEAAINSLRLRFKQNKIKINPRCTNLIFQLKVGMWNEMKTNYLRGDKIGHLDAIDALVYLNRNVNATKNPYPAPETPHTTHFINPQYQKPFDQESEKLANIMPFTNLKAF